MKKIIEFISEIGNDTEQTLFAQENLKRGDLIIIQYGGVPARKAIFVEYIQDSKYPYRCVSNSISSEEKFKRGDSNFGTTDYSESEVSSLEDASEKYQSSDNRPTNVGRIRGDRFVRNTLSETGNEVFDDSETLVKFVGAELKKISERIRRVMSGGADWSMTAVWELPGVIDRDENEGSYAFGFVVVDQDDNVVLEKRFYDSDDETIRDEDLFAARNDSELAQLFDRVRKIVNK
jgi:hypothetical protein